MGKKIAITDYTPLDHQMLTELGLKQNWRVLRRLIQYRIMRIGQARADPIRDRAFFRMAALL